MINFRFQQDLLPSAFDELYKFVVKVSKYVKWYG
jgi:hypothetical protein